MNQVITYSSPANIPTCEDFSVRVRPVDGEWIELSIYEVKVDMHQVRSASMASFDMEGKVEVEVKCHYTKLDRVVIRPKSRKIHFDQREDKIHFYMDQPMKLSIEINGELFRNLHLFANPLEVQPPQPVDGNVVLVKPGIHRTQDLLRLLASSNTDTGRVPEVLYFTAGSHYIEETVLCIPSGITVYIAGGAAVIGSLVCENVQDVSIRGRGILYLSEFQRFSAFRGVRIVFSSHVSVEGITVIDPPHYSIFLGQSDHIAITNFKSFSTRGWSDGIDMMSCCDVRIRDVFMRNSDDCIAIYGARWDFYGDSRNISVTDSVFWADVAHPLMIGTHGDHQGKGDLIENIVFDNIDILEHHEPQENYWGAMAINAGDRNTIRNILYSNIRVDDFEQGQLFDIRVVFNKDYNPVPGSRIENITFKNIEYSGNSKNPSRIQGYDVERIVDGVTFINLRINGELVDYLEENYFSINDFAQNVVFMRG